MTDRDRAISESVLQHLLLGGYIGGIRFGGIPQVLIDAPPSVQRPNGQVYINLGNVWQVFAARPAAFPQGPWDNPDIDTDEQELLALCALRFADIVGVELGVDAPDLILSFRDGRVFFLSGRHDQYEPWDMGVAFGDPGERWKVVACPGNELAVWAPKQFTAADEAR